MAVCVTVAPAGATAILHDSVAAFTRLDVVPGGSVSAARRDAAAMFDGATQTMRSLGVGGALVGGIETDRAITAITLTELTFGTFTNHREQVTLSLGFDGDGDGRPDDGWVDVGVLRNDEWRNPDLPAVTQNAGQGAATLAGAFDNSLTRYIVTVTEGTFNLFRLLDGSPGAAGRDGFDIAELRVTSIEAGPDPVVPVPAPAGLALFGAGLLGLGLVQRKRRKAA